MESGFICSEFSDFVRRAGDLLRHFAEAQGDESVARVSPPKKFTSSITFSSP
jgi:hypothetical protein